MEYLIKDPKTFMDEGVYAALSAINPNTTPSYPPGLFTGDREIQLPVTVYEVDCTNTQIHNGQQRMTNVAVRVDTFAANETALEAIAAKIREAMLKIVITCDLDRTQRNSPGGLVRRSMHFSGILDHQSGIIYSR